MAVRYAALSACQKVRMPSMRAEKYIRDASGWRKDVTDGNDNGTDGQTDGQTDRQTDRRTDRVRRNMRPPPREEGRIIMQAQFYDPQFNFHFKFYSNCTTIRQYNST